MAGAKGAPVKVEKPYEHQEYPKALYADDGEHRLIADAAAEARLLKTTKKAWADNPSDFYPDDHPDKPEKAEEGDEEVEKPKSKAQLLKEAKAAADAAK